ncbi:hypothetical protein [Pseudomonas lundensis]|uniref:hypothetical protein n=1 Tax=Pseudomonas lundensis TaxID=86185 RepID=UPI00064249B1|nr:hypothetical protein [Pseudomonas lundensis]
MVWQLAQVLWVGGLWLMPLGLLPVLAQIGLAPLLVEEIGNTLEVLLVIFSAVCVFVQALVLARTEGVESIWRDLRGQLLLMALVGCALYLAGHSWLTEALRWQSFFYWLAGFSGLILVLQPIPGESIRARFARP